MNKKERDNQRRKILADNIGRLRYQAGYSQRQLSNMTGICLSTIQRYEWNRQEPRFSSVCRIADALQVDIRQLVMSEKDWKAIEGKTHGH